MTKKLLLWGVLLGAATSIMICLAELYLPNNIEKESVMDVLALPGAFIASIYYTEGVHTGGGAPYWGYAVMVCNFLVYVLFWLLVFAAAKHTLNRHDHEPESKDV
jgi:hypothetical protein